MIKSLIITILVTILLSACQPQVAPAGIFTPTPVEVGIPTETGKPTQNQEPVSATATAPITQTPESPTQTATATARALVPKKPDQPITGIHIHQLTSSDQLSLFENAEAHWTRFDDFHWDRIEPEEGGAYQWGEVDEAALISAANSGAQTIGIVLFAPEWAQKKPGVACGPFAETALDEFASFMNALVSRYSQPPYNVKYWEIGNEPDIDHSLVDGQSGFGCWGDQEDPYYGGGYYAEMLKASYGQIKEADPQAQVIIGGLLLDCDPINPPETSVNSGEYKNCSSSRFLEGILKNGGGDYFDGVSFHAYDYYAGKLGQYLNSNWHSSWNESGPVLINKADYLHSLLAAYGHADKFLINTELALICGRDGTEADCLSDDFALTKAYYISEANAATLALGLRASIWYSLTGWRASGLVDRSLNPYPAYEADQFSAAQLKDAAYVTDVSDFPGIKGYKFMRDGTRMWILWSLDGENHTIHLPSSPSNIFNALGDALPVKKDLTITLEPVYLEWEPGMIK